MFFDNDDISINRVDLSNSQAIYPKESQSDIFKMQYHDGNKPVFASPNDLPISRLNLADIPSLFNTSKYNNENVVFLNADLTSMESNIDRLYGENYFTDLMSIISDISSIHDAGTLDIVDYEGIGLIILAKPSIDSSNQALVDPRRNERENEFGSDKRRDDSWDSWAFRMNEKYRIFFRSFMCKNADWNRNHYGNIMARGKNVATMQLQNRDGSIGTAYLGAVWSIPCGNRMMRVEMWATDECVRICHVLGTARLWMGKCRFNPARNYFIPKANSKWTFVNIDMNEENLKKNGGKYDCVKSEYDLEYGTVVVTRHLLDSQFDEPTTSNQTREIYSGLGFINPFQVQ